ncbi:hypothetical protein SCMC78_04570 [Streptomyces sp. CMC78]|uniref:Uncharacterized protein n=1 Tax=Streptomyces sp. CMC78 TaxID=3231512 RepID=A0AB33KGR2_9ACTN
MVQHTEVYEWPAEWGIEEDHSNLTPENPRCKDDNCLFPPCAQQRREEHVHGILTSCEVQGVFDRNRNCKHYDR